MQISAVIITYNEERNIERCLTSLQGVVDEIVVVDSFSKDRTEAICNSFSTRFLQHAFEGHIQQKNYAIDCATYDWVLSLDADEALTETLRKSILAVKNKPEYVGYSLNRLTNYCGHWVKYCGWYPDTKMRLIDRRHARWQGVNPHDRMEMNAGEPVGFLTGDLLHYSYYTKEDHLKQIEYFGDIAAREQFKRGVRSNWLKIGVKVFFQFIKSFFIKRGFLDGTTGFTISRLSAYATYRKYVKLLNLQKQHEVK
jgi:glycosyltransferase involved in cell wall biosynthesis